MKVIGLLGGMSWESSVEYYRIMNEEVKRRLGGLHSAKIIMLSVDFAVIRELMLADQWEAAGVILAESALTLEKAGADMIIIGTNTMHMVAPQIEATVNVPVLHIADATADVASDMGVSKVGLLGTGFTMERDFYKNRLKNRGLEVIVPEAHDRVMVDRVIFDELCKGVFSDASRAEYVRVIDGLISRGAEVVILGCTEIGLLVRPEDVPVPLLDTCHIHAVKAVDQVL